jgi:hypothetical protein
MHLMSKLYDLLYFRTCRAYARHILEDRPADTVMRYLCSLHFWKVHRYWPHFKNPRSYSEKVWGRMLFDRDPRWTMLSDKLLVRDYVVKKLGNEYLVPLLWSGDKPEEIPFDELPSKFVIKTNHGCGFNIVVTDKTQLDQTKARLQLKKWLCVNYCQDLVLGLEWGYKNIRPTIIIESFLDDNGRAPIDYKLRCFSGRVEFLTMHFNRVGLHAQSLVCDRDFTPIECILGTQYKGKFERPANYKRMIQAAETLSQEFDFIRVDLYSLKNRIYFGELTFYPGGGLIRFFPRRYDFQFGEKWKMI